MRGVAQAEGDRQQVHAGIGKRKLLGFAGQPCHAGAAPAASRHHHRQARIADHHPPLPVDQQARHIAGTAGQVDREAARPGHPAGQRALPQAMDAEAHQVVHQVIARRDRIEHHADAPAPFGGADGLVAETVVEQVLRLHRNPAGYFRAASPAASSSLRFIAPSLIATISPRRSMATVKGSPARVLPRAFISSMPPSLASSTV